ncbi:MAG: hypothetical protein HQM05_15360 [Magnetococcales bacterium]|nr:hypothetical protein [Magnetococcales bacterium]
MYDNQSSFDVHVFLQSGGTVEHANTAPEVVEDPTETDLAIIIDEIEEWLRIIPKDKFVPHTWGKTDNFIVRRDFSAIAECIFNPSEKNFKALKKWVFSEVSCAAMARQRQIQNELRDFHHKFKITQALWKRKENNDRFEPVNVCF